MSRKSKRKNRVSSPVRASVSPKSSVQVPLEGNTLPFSVIQAQMFESAEPPKRLSAFFADATDDYADQIADDSIRREMRANSRKVYLTEGCANHGVFTLGVHCIGEHGPDLTVIPAKEKGRQASDPSAPAISAEERSHLEWLWYHFTEDIDICEHLRIAVEALEYDGEIFFRMVNDPQIDDVNLNLEQIEAKRVQTVTGALQDDIVGGIQFKGMHPIRYYVLPKSINPLSPLPLEPEQVLAEDMLHFAVMRLPDQHRGLPWMQSVLNDIAETKIYKEYHLGAANAAARNSGGVVEAPAGSVVPGQTFELQPTYTAPNPGEIKQLFPGLVYKQGTANWPTATYQPFIECQQTAQAAGMHLTKAMLTNDFEKHNYSSFRGEMIVYWAIIRYLRNRLEKMILNPLFDRWIWLLADQDKTADSVISRYDGRLKRIPRSWSWSPIPAYDMADLISALGEAVQNGFLSRRMAVSILGYDFEQVEQERKEDDFLRENSGTNEPDGQNL